MWRSSQKSAPERSTTYNIDIRDLAIENCRNYIGASTPNRTQESNPFTRIVVWYMEDRLIWMVFLISYILLLSVISVFVILFPTKNELFEKME